MIRSYWAWVPNCRVLPMKLKPRYPFNVFFFLCNGFASFLLSFLASFPRFPIYLYCSTSLWHGQLNLIHSEVSNLAGFDVEGVINPTNAELELKDDLGEQSLMLPFAFSLHCLLHIFLCGPSGFGGKVQKCLKSATPLTNSTSTDQCRNDPTIM